MTVFDKYISKILIGATFITALSLTLIILLTQSVRYLELVIESDASLTYFFTMIALALPKFLEAILPLSFAIGVLYTAHYMISHRETVIMNSVGLSPLTMGKSFFISALILMVIQFFLSGWGAPLAVAQLQETRTQIKSHYATLLFREGVFSRLDDGLTVYVEKRQGLNELQDLIIHDEGGRLNDHKKTTIIAKRGIVNLTDDQQQLLIYNGTQYLEDKRNKTVSRLDFNQYTLDIPITEKTISARWKEPDERVFQRLFISKQTSAAIDIRKNDEFLAEIHKRLSTPFLYLAFTICIFIFVFMSPWNRRNFSLPMVKASLSIIAIQAGYITIYNEARDVIWLNSGLYALTLSSIIFGLLWIYKKQRRLS